ncbi:hypothetical protein BKA70DRAFT_860438 [Coprinopsis sp. MPI-PUGE-AT-0042]|nr:hypothetical protein BKA70DRAFT_860438 [Coprinopsis sp. MPI-PUGE-AT-0042]
MSAPSITLLGLNGDIVPEILGHLGAGDLARLRQVCRALYAAIDDRAPWSNAYERSNLLLPEGPSSSQTAKDLETHLVRSTLLHRCWGPNPSRDQQIKNTFTFPRALPAYSFDAQIILGRYLQLAEQDAISWYDLDGDCKHPLVVYECPYIAAITGFLSYQTNAQGEGESSVWVTFICSYPMRIMVLKLFLDGTRSTVSLETTLSAESVVEVKLGHDYILPVKEFTSRDEPLELFHIPTKTAHCVPRHARVQNLGDLGHMSYLILPTHLLMLFPSKSETHIEAYQLPHQVGSTPGPLLYRGVYPHMISRSSIFNRPTCHNGTDDNVDNTKIDLLAIVYMRQQTHGPWTSKVNLHLLEACLIANSASPSDVGTIEFETRCSEVLNVGIAATTLAASSHNGVGYAVTHSLPGPTLRVYHVRDDGGQATLVAHDLKLPEGLNSREMLAFDGFRGRICLVHGWTRIEIVDYS